MCRVIFLTGATGFLGTQVIRQLVQDDDNFIIALVRGKSKEDAVQRATRAWWEWPEVRKLVGARIDVLDGDISDPQLGLSPSAYYGLVKSVTHIVHTAADLRLDAPIEALRKTNVQGTANVIRLARAVNIDHGLSRLAHVSTAYVAGMRQGVIPEAALASESGFNSNYELSKYEGEQLVQAVKNEIPVTVFRPGMIVGDSTTGAVKTFNTVYFPLRLFLNRKIRVFPGRRSMKVNMVPVDYVAAAVARLTLEPEAEGRNFHLVVPHDKLPTVGELLDFTRQWARTNLGEELPRPICVPMPLAMTRGVFSALKSLLPSRRRMLKNLITLAPYFNETHQFSRENSDRLLGACNIDWQKSLPPMLAYAVSRNFLNRSPRTVHEQVLFRLESQSLPVTYHDIVNGQIIHRDTAQVRGEMLQAAAALQQIGVGKGDRVALVGLNSTRYLTIDIAIGLVGAVSVPVYYTSPPEEIDTILKDAAAKAFFVGTPKIGERLGELKTRLPIVNFHRENAGAAPDERVMAWEKFLNLGSQLTPVSAGHNVPAESPVGFNSLATIRYTSGTMGEPKGASFDHENLRWMAETTAAMMPWQARNRRVAYISHLPLNHVVEGLLATYCQYYVPAPVDIYFLENLRELPKVMKNVRPTVFFSIPRFYEKLWETFTATGPGRIYANLPAGSLKKQALRSVLRPIFLKKAGLDKCLYFLAGSAPSSPDMLHNLQELGVDVHNAYGLTEAPLVSLNRLGANQIGTAGQPLPETDVTFGEDGEILVRGPQVMRGYLGGKVNQPIVDGWLKTGDIGHRTENGALVIDGRKKEILKTSYGKFIHPGKIESLLKEIGHVDEAMVVGDGRPYCNAILWVSKADSSLAGFFNEQIAQVNTRLSHPEQIKRWAVLENHLSIGQGLTPNLKLKRNQVASSLSETISALYEGKPCPAGDVICTGSYSEKEC